MLPFLQAAALRMNFINTHFLRYPLGRSWGISAQHYRPVHSQTAETALMAEAVSAFTRSAMVMVPINAHPRRQMPG